MSLPGTSQRGRERCREHVVRFLAIAVVFVLGGGLVSAGDASTPEELALTEPSLVIAPDSGMLTLPVDLTVDERGNVLVLDWTDGEVVVVPAEGGGTITFGRKGDGEGDFEAPSNIGAGDGQVRVVDQLRGRLHFLDYDGRLVGGADLKPGISTADVGPRRIAYTTASNEAGQPLVTVADVGGRELYRVVAPVVPPEDGWDLQAMQEEIVAGGIPDQLRNHVLPAIRSDGGVWAFLATESVLQRYDTRGRLAAERTVDPPERAAILAHFRDENREAERSTVAPLEYVSHVEAVGEQVWLLWNVPPGTANAITVHGPDGSLVHRLTLPGIPAARHFSIDEERQRLYLTTDDNSLLSYALPGRILGSGPE